MHTFSKYSSQTASDCDVQEIICEVSKGQTSSKGCQHVCQPFGVSSGQEKDINQLIYIHITSSQFQFGSFVMEEIFLTFISGLAAL